ncbi:MOXD1 homolog 2-like [Malaya genurostris]|uniref:MOXD1 homolog 2-like n=1 Tax=Malaya genurostris TaxID=325434 RepID=UPI0026F37F6B|nr:MOXD1 homolog 2-like [Malaya genurostris]XP_058462667.1 MOXD1 homolog 2-like [Malaya genurostris]XP_058462668.1 MOXD1 homolog 2-like [Malaya genurostris]XP_058462669.1 MOXD1 homolog 2-like [Malaya genurostris]XP_058462670.1 MOXD1 homolog 2-like [Malaya genurostris]
MCQANQMANVIYCFVLVSVCLIRSSSGAHWDHSVFLDDEYRLLWTISGYDITFEVQARTHGYIGLGFSKDGTIYGADIVIGWVDQGQVHFQDRHVKKNGDGQPLVDSSQDYVLLLGYENQTHTVLRFKRKLDTCDVAYDVPITNDTMRVIFMYHDEEPHGSSYTPGSLPDPAEAFKQARSLFLTQRVNQAPIKLDARMKIMELRNQDVELPRADNTLHWCKMFKLSDINRKHHLIRYEPVFDSASSVPYLNHIILHECQGSSPELEIMSRENGRPCYQADRSILTCNSIVAAWTRGSEGFSFPVEAGYPLDSNQARFYLMETHYSSSVEFGESSVSAPADAASTKSKVMVDNSGLKIYYTSALRNHDAGVLSVGMDPNWRHIIPPGQDHVVSEGHCVGECTQRAFPRDGINIFAVMMRTHQIGRQIKLRQIRYREELLPIAHDRNTDYNYQEYRRLASTVRVLPGDRLIAECIYDSSGRAAITLGGLTTREETCLVLTLYYPRQKELTTCHSLPSLPTVLHSLGINELVPGSNPVRIASPTELSGMTLETRLISYDWRNNFKSFQYVTRKGSFKPLCWSAKNQPLAGTESLDGYAPNITKTYKLAKSCSFNRSPVGTASGGLNVANVYFQNRNRYVTESEANVDLPQVEDDELDDNNVIEGAARSKVSRSSATETMGLSGASMGGIRSQMMMAYLLFIIFLNAFRIVHAGDA